MVREHVQPGKQFANRRKFSAVSLAAALLCAGCASPGPPKPPSLHLPQVVTDLSAERRGDHVLLRWTTPSKTTDNMEIQGAISAELCREAGTGPSTPAAKLSACVPVRRLAVTPGLSEMTDTLPPLLRTDPVTLLTYRIQIFNSKGHSAGESNAPAYSVAGEAPAAISGFQGTLSEQGAVLEWLSTAPQAGATIDSIDLKRLDLSAPHPTEKKAKQSAVPSLGKSKSAHPTQSETEDSNEVHLRAVDSVTGAKIGTAGTVDTTVAVGETYTYSARRIRKVNIGSHQLELQSEPVAVVTLIVKDVFPPKTPTGVATISGNAAVDAKSGNAEASPYIDLSWEPNGESDLAGYRVYRQLARQDGSPQGPLARLTAVPVTVPAFRDVAVKAGQGYIYSVTAVDAAGNESAPSEKALEDVETPQ